GGGAVAPTGSYPLGMSRPDLVVTDLPTPEEVFGVSRIGPKEAIKYAIGPSLIALGVSIGSGEWLLGPLAVGTQGFDGILWVVLVSAILQVFYNYEISRYVMATGEVPVVGFGRTPPGAFLWIPLALLIFFFAFIWGGWASAAGQGVFVLITGDIPGDADLQETRLLAIGLIAVIFVITLLARRISRALELTNWFLVGSVLTFLLLVDIFIVPAETWWDGFSAFFKFQRPPEGTDATLLGGLAGFTALASGLNWYLMNHYRDKGYGMGHRIGFIAGLRGERKEVAATGATFPDDERNTALWKRWTRFLTLDLWGVFFLAALLGMLLPTILMARMVEVTGRQPTDANVATFIAEALQQEQGDFLFYVALIIGVFILFSTQLGIFEALVRNMTDAVNASPRLHRAVGRDPRRFYYPFMFLLAVVISIVLHLELSTDLILISANMSNLGAMIFPFIMIYLNAKLPRAARPSGWRNVILLVNVVFFGFFFVNFVAAEYGGGALVEF
ncbi:MAG: Nramp family divalent metal transporter, partial [Actinomycetota bacterium]